MKISRHKVQDIPFQAARWRGGEIKPEIVILHDTASSLKKGAAAGYLAQNTAKVSVHFVVERDGTIVQQVETNRRANHAGASSWMGRKNCNDFSIGIEIVNPGKMTFVAGDPSRARSWWGEVFKDGPATDFEALTTPQHGAGVWMDYPEAQMAAVLELLTCLFRDIPSLKHITTHWFVSPGRKIDVNPLFPLEHVKARVLGRDDPLDAEVDSQALAVPVGAFVQVVSPASSLNLRRWPSFQPNILTTVPHGAVVPVLMSGEWSGQKWLKILFDGQEGWIVARYTATMP